MTPATFGDLLDVAIGHLEAATLHLDRYAADPQAAARQVHRLIVVMTRHVHDVAPWDEAEALGRDDLTWWQQAAVDITEALRVASSGMAAALGGLAALDSAEGGTAAAAPGDPLAGAATALLAARDLLHTHRTVGADGIWADYSEWAAVVTSAPVARALADQVARWSLHLASLAGWLAEAAPGDPPDARRGFAVAGRWLRHASAAAGPARHADPVSSSDLALLCAIPSAAMAHREAPRSAESPADLCRGITLSAARLQAATRGAAERAAWSPVTTAGAWRWTATAGAVTCHLSELMLRALAQRAGQLGLPGRGHMLAAADAMAAARNGWHQLAAGWGDLTTETRFLASAAVSEASDLLLRLGRLARANAAWTPAAKDRAPLRDPAELVPDAGTAAAVVAAVHHAACAFERVARADLDAVRAAQRAGRLYVPTRMMPERCDIPRPYATAPPDSVGLVIAAYEAAVDASGQAARALDRVALAVDAPSRVMAAARAAFLPAGPEPSAGGLAWLPPRLHLEASRPGPVEAAVRDLGVTDPIVLLRAAAIDAAGRQLIAQARRVPGGDLGPESSPPRAARPGPGPANGARRQPGPARRRTAASPPPAARRAR